MTASGSRWIRCATSNISTDCGRAGRRHGRCGNGRRSFWRGKRVFLTGHTGFKGAGWRFGFRNWAPKCSGYALAPPTQPNLFELASVEASGRAHHRRHPRPGRAARAMAAASRRSSFTWRRSRWCAVYSDPVGTYATNVMGTVTLLEAARGTASARGGADRHQRQML